MTSMKTLPTSRTAQILEFGQKNLLNGNHSVLSLFFSGIMNALPYSPSNRRGIDKINKFSLSTSNNSSDQRELEYVSPTDSAKSSPSDFSRSSKRNVIEEVRTNINNKRLSQQLTSRSSNFLGSKAAPTPFDVPSRHPRLNPKFFGMTDSSAAKDVCEANEESQIQRKSLVFPQIDEFLPQKPEEQEDLDSEVPKNSRTKFLQRVKSKSRFNVCSAFKTKNEKREHLLKIEKLRKRIGETINILDLAISSCGVDEMCLSMNKFHFGDTDESFGKMAPEKLKIKVLDFLESAELENFTANEFFFQLPYQSQDSKEDLHKMQDALSMWITGNGNFPAKFHDHHVLLNERCKFQACLDCLQTLEKDEKDAL